MRTAAFSNNNVTDSIHLELSNGPTFSGLRLGMSHISFEGDENHSAIAETIEKGCKLVDAEFEYVCETNGVQVFRKRK